LAFAQVIDKLAFGFRRGNAKGLVERAVCGLHPQIASENQQRLAYCIQYPSA